MAQIYLVKRGDTLRKIAKARLDDAALSLRIAEFNGLRDPNRLAVDQRLEIPSRRDLTPPPARTREVSPQHGLVQFCSGY